MAESQDEIVSNFCNVTGATAAEAQEHLDAANWDVNTAVAEFFQSRDDDDAGTSAAGAAAAPTVEPAYTGPRTLDGRPAPQSRTSASAASRGSGAPAQLQKKKGLMTFSSLKSGSSSSAQPGGGGGHHGHHGHGHHGHDDDDDDDDDDYSSDDETRDRGDLFAGGEKSGLAVKDPSMAGNSSQKIMRDIVSKAKQNRSEPGPSAPAPSRFRGSGVTLGGEGTESRVIPDPAAAAGGSSAASAAPAGPTEERSLHIWTDGFSIDDGPLHRYDDPRNAADLAHIRQGRAPLHLMNVAHGQPVDVKLIQHEEAWHQLPRIYRPFAGEGRRLGSPTAAGETAASAGASSPAAAPAATTASVVPTIDESLPTLMIRVQLPDGTRLPARFNTTQTIGDVYDFVQRALPAAQQTRGWVLATTFPNKDHTDKAVVLGEAAEFKRGGAAVVKWT